MATETFRPAAFELAALARQQAAAGSPYLEFLRVPALSAGLYTLPAGAQDPQSPHTEDEVYVIMAGRGQLRVGSADHPVQTGSVVFVPARMEHHFHSILESLQILVLFAPAEYSRRSVLE